MRRTLAVLVAATVVAAGAGAVVLLQGGSAPDVVAVGTGAPSASTAAPSPSTAAPSPAVPAGPLPVLTPSPVAGTQRIDVREAFRELSVAHRATAAGEAAGWAWTDENDGVVDFVVAYDPRTDLLDSDERPNGRSVAHFVYGRTAGWREVAPGEWRSWPEGYGGLLDDYRPSHLVPDGIPVEGYHDPEVERRTRPDGRTAYVLTGKDPETGRFRLVFRFDAQGRLTQYENEAEVFRFEYGPQVSVRAPVPPS